VLVAFVLWLSCSLCVSITTPHGQEFDFAQAGLNSSLQLRPFADDLYCIPQVRFGEVHRHNNISNYDVHVYELNMLLLSIN
jgi:hypothetical protein